MMLVNVLHFHKGLKSAKKIDWNEGMVNVQFYTTVLWSYSTNVSLTVHTGIQTHTHCATNGL